MTVSTTNPLVTQAASALNLPASVVAAQINEESGGNATAVSSAGAEGEFQFLPSTYTGLGFPAGTEFDPSEEVKAYEEYMQELLQWSGGNVQKALAAYNAGQANWQSGLGYANTILGNAGVPGTETITPGSVTTTAAGSASSNCPSFDLFSPSSWFSSAECNAAEGFVDWILQSLGLSDLSELLERGALIMLGVVFLFIGVIKLTTGGDEHSTNNVNVVSPAGDTADEAESSGVSEAAEVAAA